MELKMDGGSTDICDSTDLIRDSMDPMLKASQNDHGGSTPTYSMRFKNDDILIIVTKDVLGYS